MRIDMNRRSSGLAAASLVVFALTMVGVAQQRERAAIPDRYKWNLAEIYPSNDAWRAAKDKMQSELPKIGQLKGKLGASAATLADALETLYAIDKELSRAFVYVGMLADQDTRESQPQGMRQEMVQLGAAFSAQASYIEPEILKLPKATLDTFIASEPRLTIYRFYLEDIIRRGPHTLSDAEEKLLADAGPLAGSPANVFNILSNADFAYPTVTLSDGKTAKLDTAAFSTLRGLPNRADREKVMSAFFTSLGGFSRTFGTTMNSEVQKVLFFSKARKYASPLAMVLDGPNIPVSVYTRLVDGVNRSLPAFHRYLKLRKQMMGLDELHYYDLYAPLVGSVDLAYTPEEAQKHVLAALAPLGTEYTSVLQRAFDGRWIDLFPNPGKRSGAYSNGGAYDVHPYILMNYKGKYDDMSTLAHEIWNTMICYFSNKTQPYPLASYPIFVA
jgi:oligoendopeptidase F